MRARLVILWSVIHLSVASVWAKPLMVVPGPAVVAHRGLLQHAPENTLVNFRACLDLRIGFEFDVRRSRDGTLVCIHDDTVDRTTNGHGAVASMDIDDLRRLDAGGWFGQAFRGEQIPTIRQVLELIAAYGSQPGLFAVDLKEAGIEAEIVREAQSAHVLERLVFIGRAIDNVEVRRALRRADRRSHVACLAQTAKDLPAVLADPDSSWAYLRFIPTAREVEQIHAAGKRAFIAGPTVAGLERANWQAAIAANVDAILTDFSLELAAATRDATESPDGQFERLARQYIREFPALSPIGATTLGDHRFDSAIDDISEAARKYERTFYQRYLEALANIDKRSLHRENQVDYQLLVQQLRGDLWRLDELQEWAWNPVAYTQLTGGAIYGLMAREFAPLEKRLQHVADRLERMPTLYEQIRATLVPARVPPIHAETAVKQNRGLISILDNMVKPHRDKLSDAERARLDKAIAVAVDATEKHQQWLEQELLPNAKGNFRIGAKLFDAKLPFALGSNLTRQDIRDRAEFELRRVRAEMYAIARGVMLKADPQIDAPEKPAPEQQQAVIAAALEKAYAEIPDRDGIVDFAKKSLEITTKFVRDRDLVTIPDDPLDIILMPEFQRGVSIAYCDSPGPLDVGQKTYYAVSPIPADWTDKQVNSFLREYNFRSIHDLTIHEAMPGHFLQLAHSNRSPRRLRAVLASGTFIEGWGVYAEQLMTEEGFLDRDPLMRLVSLKWYLRGIANAILDQAIHVDGMNREQAMKLMVHDTFQEEREAALKWIRAQLTSTQLSTYFVGYQEHRDLRAAAEKAWGDKFSLKRYHDGVLSFGSPPVRFVKALLLNEPIPE